MRCFAGLSDSRAGSTGSSNDGEQNIRAHHAHGEAKPAHEFPRSHRIEVAAAELAGRDPGTKFPWRSAGKWCVAAFAMLALLVALLDWAARSAAVPYGCQLHFSHCVGAHAVRWDALRGQGRLSSCAWWFCACAKSKDFGVLDYLAGVLALLVLWKVWAVGCRWWSVVCWMLAAAGLR